MNSRVIVGLLLLLSLKVAAQEQQLFNADLRNRKFDDVVSMLESNSPYRVYYQKEYTDTLHIDVQIHEKTIQQLFELVLKNTPLRFAIDNDHHVFITHSREIMTDLPVDFFGTLTQEAKAKADFDYSDYQQEARKIKNEETRVFIIGNRSAGLQGSASLAGYVKNQSTGEPVVGASVFIENPLIGAATDQFGYFSINIPKGRHEVKFQSLDMKPTSRQVLLYSDGKLTVEMQEEVVSLKEVVVQSERDAKVVGLQMGMERLDTKVLRQTPVALGEADVIKVMLAMPGVQSVGEGASGINVRGGATSQNLILLNDAIVFNPSHLFGFFSTFNPDVLKNAELMKSGIPAEFGGRIASVLDVSVREGNKKRFSGMGGISPITGRLTLEGPIIKEKASFLVGARSTYSGWLLKQLDSKRLQNSTAGFNDYNAHISYDISEKDNLYLTAYSSSDRFKLNNDTSYQYTDQNASLKYKRVFNNKLYGVLTASTSQYKFGLSSTQNPVTAFRFSYSINLVNTKLDFNYYLSSKHNLTFGASSIRYDLRPGKFEPVGFESLVKTETLQKETGLESALYAADNFEVNDKLTIYGGVRYSTFSMLGPRTVFNYLPGLPKETTTITDTVAFSKGKNVAQYGGFEPRVTARLLLNRHTSLKAGYNRTRQYIHMLSNTIAISPTDVWKLSDNHIRPQIGDQVTSGIYYTTPRGLYELSVEGYLKTMTNFLDYKNGAVLFLNQHIETDVIPTKGRAYGIEFLVRKNSGKLNGWFSYAYSRSLLQTNSSFSSETVNSGRFYPANFDKPHAINFISNYRFNQRFSFSLNTTYSTGRPITVPLAKYELNGSTRLAYSERNQYRIPDYFRIDLGINIEGNHKVRKLAHGSWSISVYNLTGRKNAYSVYFVSKNGSISGYKLSIFARPIPTITYNFKF